MRRPTCASLLLQIYRMACLRISRTLSQNSFKLAGILNRRLCRYSWSSHFLLLIDLLAVVGRINFIGGHSAQPRWTPTECLRSDDVWYPAITGSPVTIHDVLTPACLDYLIRDDGYTKKMRRKLSFQGPWSFTVTVSAWNRYLNRLLEWPVTKSHCQNTWAET